ncbi:MAG TPA: RNB domain-containing ribonuclease [Lacunisphaera sp.]|jgi:exoribonuclease-2
MTNTPARQSRAVLTRIAHRVMLEKGLDPDFSPGALAQLNAIHGAAAKTPATRDLTGLLWCSIDNDDSRDLDQLSVAEALPEAAVKLMVAVADVAGLVPQGSPLDAHARKNTTSVYTAGGIFPMLPEKLSTDLTSLGFGVDRLAIVIEMTYARDGSLIKSDIYEAAVRNKAKLAYDSVAAWLEGSGPMPAAIGTVAGLAENIKLQDHVARQLRARRHQRGALSLQTIQARAVFVGDLLSDLAAEHSNQAKNLIEDLMVAANGVAARFLTAKKFPSIRRVVRTPEKWDRIVELAAGRGTTLPPEPDGLALEEFLLAARTADPINFPDLSLTIIKLVGAGEYVVELPGQNAPGHFGLAVKDYAHSTAPNRRYPDLLLQRLVKAALAGSRVPYSNDELVALADHCTEQEDAAKKVERQVVKSAAAMLLTAKIGEKFDATISGATDKGVWVRLFHPPIEGKLQTGGEGRQIGDRLRVELVHTDVERGHIDFVAVH